MTGRTHAHRWLRFDDPIFRARHYIFYGPHRTIRDAAKATLRRDEWAGAEACGFGTGDYLGICTGAVPDNDLDPLLVVMHISSEVKGLQAASALVHETGHAVDFVLEARGVTHSAAHGETWRFYQEVLYVRGRVGLKL